MPFTGGSYSKTKTFANSGTILPADLNSIQDDIGGQLNTSMITAGVSDSTVVRRGTSIIVTEEARTNVAYGLQTTPDRVQSVVLPTNGLIFVAYEALWKSSISSAGAGAIFLGANQVKTQQVGGALINLETFTRQANLYQPLSSTNIGLVSVTSGTSTQSDTTTGQAVGFIDASGQPWGGFTVIFAAAGTYDVSIQFRATSGSVTVKERKLWVWTMGF